MYLLTFKTTATPGTDDEVTRMRCGKCGATFLFHIFTPLWCEKCGIALDDVVSMRLERIARVSYHRSGIDEHNK